MKRQVWNLKRHQGTMENEGADFFHLLLAQKVVYEEDALKFLNTLLSKGNKRRVRNSDELLERLAGHNRSVSKFGFEGHVHELA